MARNEDRAIVAVLDGVEALWVHGFYPVAFIGMDLWQVREFARRAADALPAGFRDAINFGFIPVRKSHAQIAFHGLALAEQRRDTLDDPASSIGCAVWPEQFHRPPVDQVPGDRFQPPGDALAESGALIDVRRADILFGIAHLACLARWTSGSSSWSKTSSFSNSALTGNARMPVR